MRDGSPAFIGMAVDSCVAEGWRKQRCSSLAVGALRLAVVQQFGVVFSRTPCQQRLLERLLIDVETVGERLQVGSKRHDLAHVEVAVRPAVEPMADAMSKGVIDR